MKQFLMLMILVLLAGKAWAQEEKYGGIAGRLRDKEMANEPLPFANVFIKGTTEGTTTDMDGYFSVAELDPGTYTVVFSFVGYETVEIPGVQILPGKVTEINASLSSEAAALDEVVITTVARKDSEIALLLEQKRAVAIKESIGSVELSKMGISDVAAATAKISGVATIEASGDVFVRGLGDRYLYTTLNGLPVPSDDVERKNIDLSLFSTGIIQNVAISKTFSAEHSADQASGTIDITSRTLAGNEEFAVGVGAGINTNVIGQFSNFKVSPNQKDVSFGFYDQEMTLENALIEQRWDPIKSNLPINRSYGLTAGKRVEDLSILFTGSQSTEFEYQQGIFREYRSNNLYDSFSDVEIFQKTFETTALFDVGYRLNDDHRLQVTSLFINKFTDEVYESGRNGEGIVFEETARDENLNQFIRDQNLKQTSLWVNQLFGFHDFENNELEWAVAYNLVNADEPNRIRNEVNIDGDGFVQLGRTGGFQQRKSSQRIDDQELNAVLQDRIVLGQTEAALKNTFLEIGGSFRNKERDFISQFFGVTEEDFNTVNPPSIDDFSEVFTAENFESGNLRIRRLSPDVYSAQLLSYSGFATFNLAYEKWNINIGGRYQKDDLQVDFEVNNYPSTLPQFANQDNESFYPAVNIKYSPDDNYNLRLSASKTITLPEFKEIAPFQYVSQTGQITRGNPELEASKNFNLDLKYEYFPGAGEIISLSGFYKQIKNPINRVQDRGAAGVFSYFNTGEQANIYGLEFTAALNLIESDDPEAYELELGFNASRIWHSQDLKEVFESGKFIRTFRYNNKEEVGLQGASDWIVNGSLNFSTSGTKPFQAAVVANYSSDKIYALGAPEVQTQPDVFYNEEIIEKGFVTLDFILNKELGEHWALEFSGKNLLNPEIERVQNIRPSSTGVETTETVRSYTKGAVLSIGLNYSF